MKEASVTIALEQPDADRQRAFDEQPDVFGDALVRIVGGIAEQLHAIMRGSFEPMVEILLASSSAASGSAAIGSDRACRPASTVAPLARTQK